MTVRAVLSRLGRIAQWIITIVAVLLLTIYFGWAFESRHMLELRPEHRIEFDAEFEARNEDETSWQDYLAIEAALADELDAIFERIARPETSKGSA